MANRYQHYGAMLFLFLSVLYSTLVLAAPIANDWQQTKANVEVFKLNVNELKSKDTVFGTLLQETNIPLNELTETDKQSILMFTISYDALVQATNKTRIAQHGFFRALALPVQQTLLKQGVLKQPVMIRIRHLKKDPIAIEIFAERKFHPSPALLTKVIDNRWKRT